MRHIHIDASRCARDNACVLTCPLGLIRTPEGGGVPEVQEDAGRFCILCGHCQAVCPTGALRVEALPDQDFLLLLRERAIQPEQGEQFLRSRRSVRAYKPEPVDRTLIARCLDTACFAPSGHNAASVRWSVVGDRTGVERVVDLTAQWMRQACKDRHPLAETLHLAGVVRAWSKGKDLVCRGAPHLLAAYAAPDAVTPAEDAHIALAYAELAAHAHGLGACWAGYVAFAARNHPPLLDALGAPPGRSFQGALMLGRPRFPFRAAPPRGPANIRWV